MAAASTGIHSEQTFSHSPEQTSLVEEIRTLHTLADVALAAAADLAAASLDAFAQAKPGLPAWREANALGTALLDAAEQMFAQAKPLRAEAECLYRQLER
jgi:hypothetical protein